MLILTLSQSMLIWGSLIGALLVRSVLRRLSRKQAVLVVHVVSSISVVFMAPMAKYGKSYESLIVGRCFAGVSRGLGFSIVMVVVAETTSRNRLGLFQSPFSVIIFVASAIGAGLGHSKVLGNSDLWVWIMYVPTFPSLLYYACYHWLTETPVYLLKCGREDDAMKTLQKLRCNDEVNTELKIIRKEIDASLHAKAIPLRSLLCTPQLRFQFFVATTVMLSPQLTGLQAIFLYSDSLLIQAGVGPQYVTFATMGMFLQSVAAFGLYIPLQRRHGTKKLFVAGTGVVAVSYTIFIVAIALHLTVPWMSYLALASMCICIFGNQVGPQLTMLSLPAELTTATTRPTIAFFSGCLFWTTGGITSLVFPYSVAAWGAYAYLPFLVLCLALLLFSTIVLPETCGRTTKQIQNSLRKKSTRTLPTLLNGEKHNDNGEPLDTTLL